jgi:predicted ferric reductase
MNRYLTPAITAIAVFILCISILFAEQKDTMSSVILYVCLSYALVCLLFLVFQIFAFVKAHTDYDEEVEDVKYQVFRAEGIHIEKEELF